MRFNWKNSENQICIKLTCSGNRIHHWMLDCNLPEVHKGNTSHWTSGHLRHELPVIHAGRNGSLVWNYQSGKITRLANFEVGISTSVMLLITFFNSYKTFWEIQFLLITFIDCNVFTVCKREKNSNQSSCHIKTPQISF